MDLNKAMAIGRLTRDPEVRTTPNGRTVASMTVATSFSWNDASGAKQEKTEFHNCVLWGKLGEIAGQFLTKGRRVYVEGRIETRSWDGQDGVKRYRTEIIVSEMIMLDGPRTGGQNAPSSASPNSASAPIDAPVEEIKVEDIPF
jgi:single-strand DNA-binding protein